MLARNRFSKNVVLLGALLSAATAKADMLGELSPYLGADYYQTWMRGQSDWKQVFPKSYRGATLYVGSRFYEDRFGAELGYDISTRTKKEWALSSGRFFNSTNSGLTGNTKVTRSGVHLDFLAFLPIANCFDLFGTIGYGWVQSKIDVTPSVNSSSQASALASTSGKGRSVLRLGVGASYMVNNMVGIRAKLGWESTSTLRVKGNQAFTDLGYQSKGWKDTTALSMGAFVKF